MALDDLRGEVAHLRPTQGDALGRRPAGRRLRVGVWRWEEGTYAKRRVQRLADAVEVRLQREVTLRGAQCRPSSVATAGAA